MRYLTNTFELRNLMLFVNGRAERTEAVRFVDNLLRSELDDRELI